MVTWCGCGSGESSGGYEHTMRGCRDRGVRQGARPAMVVGLGPAATRSVGGNASNPTIGSGMQQARESSGTLNGVGKPGSQPWRSAEKTGETVRNGEVGTRAGRQPGSEAVETPREGGRRGSGRCRGTGREARRIPREVVGFDRPGPMDRGDGDVVPIGRGAKPTRAGLRSATARPRTGDGFWAGNLEGPAG
jgi:hypothetical protein